MGKSRFNDPLYAEALLVATEHVRYMRARGATCMSICASVGLPSHYGIYELTAKLARMWLTTLREPVMREAA